MAEILEQLGEAWEALDFGSSDSYTHEIAMPIFREEILRNRKCLGLDNSGMDGQISDVEFCNKLGYPMDSSKPELLAEFLCDEVRGMRLALSKKNSQQITTTRRVSRMSLASELRTICRILSIPISQGSTPESMQRSLQTIMGKVTVLLRDLPQSFWEHKPLLNRDEFTPEILEQLEELNKMLREDYDIRRELLLRRSDVTIKSFLASPVLSDGGTELLSAVSMKRAALQVPPSTVVVDDIFNVGRELLYLHGKRVTDLTKRGIRSATAKDVIIGSVPDRGGRVQQKFGSEKSGTSARQSNRGRRRGGGRRR